WPAFCAYGSMTALSSRRSNLPLGPRERHRTQTEESRPPSQGEPRPDPAASPAGSAPTRRVAGGDRGVGGDGRGIVAPWRSTLVLMFDGVQPSQHLRRQLQHGSRKVLV